MIDSEINDICKRPQGLTVLTGIKKGTNIPFLEQEKWEFLGDVLLKTRMINSDMTSAKNMLDLVLYSLNADDEGKIEMLKTVRKIAREKNESKRNENKIN